MRTLMSIDRFRKEFEYDAVRLVAKAFENKSVETKKLMYYDGDPFLAVASYDHEKDQVIDENVR